MLHSLQIKEQFMGKLQEWESKFMRAYGFIDPTVSTIHWQIVFAFGRLSDHQ